MDTTSDARGKLRDSSSRVRSTGNKPKLTPAQRHKYQREIAIYRGIFGGTDIAIGDVPSWAAVRATVPGMSEVDKEIAAFRRWESRLWRRAKLRAQSGPQQDGLATFNDIASSNA